MTTDEVLTLAHAVLETHATGTDGTCRRCLEPCEPRRIAREATEGLEPGRRLYELAPAP